MKKLDLTIGARVYCRDGKLGKLVKVVVDPETQCVKSLIVEKGFLSKRYRVFPVSLVSIAVADEIHLLLKNDEWAGYPAFKEEEYDVLPALWEQRPLLDSEAPSIQMAIQDRDPYAPDGNGVLMARSRAQPKAAARDQGKTTLPLFLFTLLTFLAACTGLTTEPPEGESTIADEDTAVPSTPAPAFLDCGFLPEAISGGDQSVVVPEGAVAVFHKEGGFAGLIENWVIYADGRITKDSGEQGQVPLPLVIELVALANEADFYDLAASYVPQDTCCDRFTYSVTVRDCGQMHTVTAVEDTPEAPDATWDVIRTLEEILSSATMTSIEE